MNNSKSSNLPAIIVMYLLFFMIAFVTNFAGSMGVIVQNQFGASNALSQLGTLANFIAYAVMGIPAGLILKRKGYKFTSLLAIGVGLVGVAVQWCSGYAESFGIYILGAFIAGFSMCMLNTVVNPMLNTLGGGGNRGNQLVQFGGSCNSIGATIAPILLGYLIGGNVADASVMGVAPAMLAAMIIFAVSFIIVFFSSIPEPHIETPEQRAEAAAEKDTRSPLSFRHFVLGAIAIFFYVGIEVGIPNTANLYMSNMEGVGPQVAGTIIGFYWFLMMIGRIIGGLVGGKVSSRTMLATVSLLAIGLLLAVMSLPENLTIIFHGVILPIGMICMVLCGLCTSVMWGAIFNLSAEGLGKYTPAASGIFMALVCGGGIIPFFQNLMADYYGYLMSYLVPVVGLAYILFYALMGSKVTQRA
ncbi:MAG: MFS transporter [Paludibacteraceae bacterium]|nr:MFS transporter [Paludibacteraceae bacterium]